VSPITAGPYQPLRTDNRHYYRGSVDVNRKRRKNKKGQSVSPITAGPDQPLRADKEDYRRTEDDVNQILGFFLLKYPPRGSR
jgi:hypothetical protein